MNERQAQQIYSDMIQASKTAFEAKLFSAAYNTLASGMYIAVYLEDSYKLLEVELLAREHRDELNLYLKENPTQQFIVDLNLTLYQSLIHMVKTRLMLIPKSK